MTTRSLHPSRRRIFLMGAAAVFWPGHAAVLAGTFNWTGTAGANWNTAGSWDAGVPVSAADTALVFDNIAALTLNNDIPGGLTLHAIELGVNTGGAIFNGNALTFDGPGAEIFKDTATGEVRFNTPFVLNTDLTVDAFQTFSSPLRLAGAISGAGGIHFFDGVNIVQGANTFTGATLVSAGAVGVIGSGLGATSGITVQSGARLDVIRTSTTAGTAVNRALSLGGQLSTSSRKISVAGFPSAAATYSGAITLSGNAEVLAFNATGTGLNAVEFVVSGPVDLAGHTLMLRTGGLNNMVRVIGTISGAGNLDVRPNDGDIVLPAITGNRDVLVSSTGTGTVNMASLSDNGLLDVNFAAILGGPATVTGAVSGTRDLLVRGGILVLQSTASTFTGSIEARGNGLLSVPHSDRFGDAANTVLLRDGGGLRLTSGGTFPRAITLANGGLLLGSGLQTVSGDITGDGGLTVSQTQWTLTGNNTFTGGLSISGTTVIYNTDNNLGAADGLVRLGGGALNLPAALTTFDRPIETTSALTPGNLSASAGQAVTVESDITGAGAMRFDSRAVWTLTGNNTFEGRLFVLGAGNLPTTLIAASETQLGGATAPITFGDQPDLITTRPAILQAAGDITIPAARATDFRSLTVDTAGHTVTFNQPLTGRGLTKTGAGLFVLGGAITPTGGSGNSITIQQGTLRTSAANVIHDTTGVSVQPGALFDLDGFSQTIGGINAFGDIRLGSGTLNTGGGTVEGVISGTGGLAVRDGGQLMLTGANTFSGGLTVTGGARVLAGSADALGAAGNAITFDNGGLGASSLAPAPIVIDAATNLTIGAGGARFSAEGQSLVIARQLTGAAPLRFSGGSEMSNPGQYEVRLTHPANTFAGNIQLGDSQGFGDATLGIVADGSLGAPANIITLGDAFDTGEGVRTSNGTLRAFADIVFPASRTIRLKGQEDRGGGGAFDTNGHTITVNTAITEIGEGSLQIGGGGTVLLNGANTYSGNTSVSGGTTLGGSGSILSATLTGGSTLAPGNSAGLFTIASDLELYDASTLAFEIGGPARGTEHDALNVGGTLNLSDGRLALSLSNGFQPAFGQTFVLIAKQGTASAESTFAGMPEGHVFTTAGFSWTISYAGGDGNDVAITAGQASSEPAPVAISSFTFAPPPGGDPGNQIAATVTADANTLIRLEASSDLAVWLVIGSQTTNGGGSASFDVTDSFAETRRYYRFIAP